MAASTAGGCSKDLSKRSVETRDSGLPPGTDGSIPWRMGDHPAISVLLPVRNGDLYLDQAIASLAAQSWRDFEIIAVDNGSRDRSPEILRAWAEREPRLRLFRRERKGLAATLNYAAAQARAPLLARLDCDDMALPRRLEVQHGWLARRPELGLVGCLAELIDRRGARIELAASPTDDRSIQESLRSRCTFVHSSVMMRRSLFEQAGGYRNGLKYAEDFDLWCRMAETTKLAIVPQVLVCYRLHPGSTSSHHPERMAIGAACVRAAAEARRRGLADPLDDGRLRLRKSLTLLGESREEFIQKIRADAVRKSLHDLYLRMPLPGPFKYAIRRSAIGLGLRPLYSFWLKILRLFYDRLILSRAR